MNTTLIDFGSNKTAVDEIIAKGRMLFYIDDQFINESKNSMDKGNLTQGSNTKSDNLHEKNRTHTIDLPPELKAFTINNQNMATNSDSKLSFEQTSTELSDPNAVTLLYNKSKIVYAKDPYKEIAELEKTVFSDLVCICQHFKPLISTKGTDCLFSIILWDISGSIELKVFIKKADFEQFFYPGTTEHIFRPGNVILLRNVKKSSLDTFAIIFKPNIITLVSDLKENPFKSKSFAEIAIGNIILNRYSNDALDISINSKKTVSISDIKTKSFFNVMGKVISIEYGIVATVCITDFTVNSLPKNYSGTFPNNIVLNIKLFGQHASQVDKIATGSYAFFENLRINTFTPLLVAYMHDSLDGSVIPIDDERYLSEIKKRELEFYKNKDNRDPKRMKRSHNDDIKENVTNTEPNTSESMPSKIEVADKTISKDSGLKDIESVLRPVKISEITCPGTYLSLSQIKIIEVNTVTNDGTAVIYTVDRENTHIFFTKKNLSQKVFTNEKIKPESQYMCLVHLTPSGELYMIDVFVDEREYEEFRNFYKNSIQDVDKE